MTNHAHLARPARIGALVAVLLCGMTAGTVLAGNPGNPAVYNATSSVRLLAPILITEVQHLDFGRILAPSLAIQYFTVGEDDTMTVGPGTGQSIGGFHAGQYDITGTPGEPYLLRVEFAGCSDGHLGLTGLAVNPPFATPLDQHNIKIGGSLFVLPGISLGVHTCAYSIHAEYE
jgi:Domain of unknown function (DUF4402)